MKTPDPNRMARLEEAVTAYQEELFRFAAFRTGSRADAEDIVQDAFLRFAAAESRIANPRAYLYRSVANACCDRSRRPRHEPLPQQTPAPEADDSLAAEAQRIGALLDRLPDEQAEVIRLHTLSGLRFRAIAETLDCPVTTVKSRFRYGIEKLRTILQH